MASESAPLWRFTFYGRPHGALGDRSLLQNDESGWSMNSALLKLYDHFEHIRLVKVEEIMPDGSARLFAGSFE